MTIALGMVLLGGLGLMFAGAAGAVSAGTALTGFGAAWMARLAIYLIRQDRDVASFLIASALFATLFGGAWLVALAVR